MTVRFYKILFAAITWAQLYGAAPVEASGAFTLTNCRARLIKFFRNALSPALPKSAIYRIAGGSLVWDLGKQVTRQQVEAIALPIAEDLINATPFGETLGGKPIKDLDHELERMGISLKDLINAKIAEELEKLKQEIRAIPIGEGNFLLPKNSWERSRLDLVDFDYILAMKIKKRLVLMQRSDGNFQLVLHDEKDKAESDTDSIFGFKRAWWKPSPWKKSVIPKSAYPGIYRIRRESPAAISLDDLLAQLENSLKTFSLDSEDSKLIWRTKFLTAMVQNDYALQNWWLDILSPTQQEAIKLEDLMSWAVGKGIYIGRKSLEEYLRTHTHIEPDLAKALAAQLEGSNYISGAFDIPLFNGEINVRLYMKAEAISPEAMSELETKGRETKLQYQMHFEIMPNWEMPTSQMPSQEQIDDLVLALELASNLH